MDTVWSRYSEAIFDAYLHSTDNILVQACPGAGKTTNIAHMWGLDDKSTLYLVFNKHNQIEAEQKLSSKPRSSVLTLNSLGHRILLNNYGNVILNDKKVHGIARQVVPVNERARYDVKKAQREQQWTLIKAVQAAKLYVQYNVDTYDAMVSTYDLDEYGGMYDDIKVCLEISDNDVDTVDFADQLRLPVVHGLNMPHYDVVLGDEVQDFNQVQAMLVQKLCADRYVLVGDRHQSIYGFRGAMTDSMAALQGMYSCVELPLSISYRCGKEIVKVAQDIYPEIEPWEHSGNGKVMSIKDMMAEDNVVIDSDTLVLCRVNAPLIAMAYKFLDQGIACHVRGRDVGQGLVTLIRKLHASDVGDLIDKVNLWYEERHAKGIAKDDDTIIQRAKDKLHSILLFCAKAQSYHEVDVVIDYISSLFEEGKGVCLSTIHKAKGLEAQQAVIIEYDLMAQFADRARQPWQAVQERNAAYVAVTRAKDTLVY